MPFYFEPHKEFLYRDLFPASIDTDSFMPMGMSYLSKPLPFSLCMVFSIQLFEMNRHFNLRKSLKNGSDAHVKLYNSHGHFSLIRRTTSWHVGPILCSAMLQILLCQRVNCSAGLIELHLIFQVFFAWVSLFLIATFCRFAHFFS